MEYCLLISSWTFVMFSLRRSLYNIQNGMTVNIDNDIHNKLFQIQPILGEWRPASRKSRREQVVISRLRIGHTRLTHSFILKQELQPQCLTCQTTCTVKQILIECRTFPVIRKRFFKVNSLTDMFKNVKIVDVLSFLKDRVVPKNMTT